MIIDFKSSYLSYTIKNACHCYYYDLFHFPYEYSDN